MEGILFTPAAIIDLLSKIDELSDLEIGISETIDGDIQLVVGDSTYSISTDNAVEIDVDDEVVDEVEDVNTEAYENLDDSVSVQYDDTVESGIIKELAKSLLLGGMIRLSKSLLTK